MKRLLFISFSLYLVIASGHAQISITTGPPRQIKQQVLDTAAIQVFYEVISVSDSLKPDKTTKDYMALEIGKGGISKFYSDNARRRDSVMTELRKRNMQQFDMKKIMDDNGISSSGDDKVIFKNYPKGKLTTTDHILSTDYLYEENMNPIEWQILPDTMTYLSYPCQKATIDFRGRHYEAWFTSDFPVNDGPWKFYGLPGLILRIEDSKKNYSFVAIGIEQKNSPIDYDKKDYLKTSREEVSKIRKRFIANPMQFIRDSFPQANIQIKMKSDDGGEKTNDEIQFPYNPIELN